MSTVSNQVTWTKKVMDVFCEQLRQKVKVPFYCLSLADEYNNKMGNVDLGDQLRGYYRFHFIRKRKWWWSFWMWAISMSHKLLHPLQGILQYAQDQIKVHSL